MLVFITLFKLKKKLVTIFVIFLLVVSSLYVYINYLQQSYNNAQSTEKRCISDLTAVKYQLHVVTEYKNRIDKLLTETQNAHMHDNEKFKDIMESCVAMKQQSSICHSQFEDLQIECKRINEDYDQVLKELRKAQEIKLRRLASLVSSPILYQLIVKVS